MTEDANAADWCQPFIAANVGRWERLLATLVRTPSVFEAEDRIVAQVEEYIASLGARVERIVHDPQTLRSLPGAQQPISDDPGRHSLVTRVPAAGGGRTLVLNAHLDTVASGDEAAWDRPPFSGHLDEARGLMFGRGAMDDKAGVVISLAVLETLLKAPVRLAGDVVFHFVLEDETTGNGTLLCLAAGHRGDGAIIVDGTRTDRAINQHAGQLQTAIRVKGKPVSVSVAHLGVNAAHVLMDLLRHLSGAVGGLNADRAEPWTAFPSPFQFAVGSLASDSERFTIPERAEGRIFVTFPPPYTVERITRRLIGEIEAYASAAALPYLPELGPSMFAVEPVESPAGELSAVLQASAGRLGMPAITVGPSTGTSDLRHFVNAGIPCLLYGPGTGFNPHRPNESYQLGDLPAMVRMYLEIAREWCGAAAA